MFQSHGGGEDNKMGFKHKMFGNLWCGVSTIYMISSKTHNTL